MLLALVCMLLYITVLSLFSDTNVPGGHLFSPFEAGLLAEGLIRGGLLNLSFNQNISGIFADFLCLPVHCYAPEQLYQLGNVMAETLCHTFELLL